MTIQSIDNLVAAISAGKSCRFDWQKLTGAAAYTAGRWYEMFSLGGNPAPTTFPGTAKAFVNCNELAGDGTTAFGIPICGNASPDLKHLLNLSALTSFGTGVPSILKLVDLQGYWPGIDMNVNTLQSLTGTPTLRYANGEGLRLSLVARATTGATAHSLALSYTNQAGVAGRALGATVACTPSAIVPHILHTGVAANNYGPELPLAAGDYGVQNVASVTLSAASGAGTAALLLYKPIATIALSVASLQSEKDLLNQIPSLPQIKDGACLGFLLYAGAAVAASGNFSGHTEVVWG